MKADTATLADVKLVLTAPLHIQTKRSGYAEAKRAEREREGAASKGRHRRGRAGLMIAAIYA